MNRRQSFDKPAILTPPVQFIVPSPTASASPSPRLIQNSSPVAHHQQQHHHHHHHQIQPQQQHHQLQHHLQQQQQVSNRGPTTATFIPEVLFVSNNTGSELSGSAGTAVAARRLSTASQHSSISSNSPQLGGGGGGGGTILFRPSPTQSPAHLQTTSTATGNIIITNGPNGNNGGAHNQFQALVGNEFNTTLVGSNNIALNVKRGGGGSGAASVVHHQPQTQQQHQSVVISKRGSAEHGGTTATITRNVVAGSNGIVFAGGGASGGSSPRTTPTSKKSLSLAPSPIASPMASPTLKPNQSPIHHQIPIIGHHTGTGQQQMFQIIQTPTQQIIQSAPVGQHQQQQRTMTFQAPTGPATIFAAAASSQQQQQQQFQQSFVQQQQQHNVQQQQQHQLISQSKGKPPQQILPKPAAATTGGGNNSNNGSSGAVHTVNVVTSTGAIIGRHQQLTTSTTTMPGNSNVMRSIAKSAANTMLSQQQQQQSIANSSIALTPTTVTSPQQAAISSPILLPTGQPLIMSNHHQMPVLMQQNTPQGVQFILRQPTNHHHQLTGTPLMIHHPGSATRTTPLSQPQPQQLLRIVNGQMQLAPFIMSATPQGNTILQQATTNASFNTVPNGGAKSTNGGGQPLDNQCKLNAPGSIQLAAGNQIVQMSTGQFLQQFPAQNLNFTTTTTTTGHHHQMSQQSLNQILGQNVAFTAQGTPVVLSNSRSSPVGTGRSDTIQFNALSQPIQQQIIAAQNNRLSANVVEDLTLDDSGEKPQQQVVIIPSSPMPTQHISVIPPAAPSPKIKKPAKPPVKRKEPAKKAVAATATTTTKPKKLPEIKTPPPEPKRQKLDLANVIKLCGIGFDDDDDEEMILETDYQPNVMEQPAPQQQEIAVVTTKEDPSLEPSQIAPEVSAQSSGGGDIMITIPGMGHNENIPFSFTIPSSTASTVLSSGEAPTPISTTNVVKSDDINTSTESKIPIESMCVPTFINSVLNAQVTPTLQSQINEIQNQLMGVTQTQQQQQQQPVASSSVTVSPSTLPPAPTPPPPIKPTPYVQPKVKAPPKRRVQQVKKLASVVVSQSQPSSAPSQHHQPPSSVVVSGTAMMNKPPESPLKAIPTACGLVPSQIGNIQISQVDATKVQPITKAVSIENQIQITPILDTTTVTMRKPTITTTTAAAQAMTTQQQSVQQIKQQQQHLQPSTMHKMINSMPPLTQNMNMMMDNNYSGAMPPTVVQINLPQNPLPVPMTVQQHSLVATLTGALSLTLIEDGRLLLKHDVNAPQDVQSRSILQAILGGALGNVTLMNEPSAPKMEAPRIVAPAVRPSTATIPANIIRKPVTTTTSQVVMSEKPATPSGPMDQSPTPLIGFPKIGPHQQLFSMNTITNQITHIQGGVAPTNLGPMERLLIVPAGIDAKQLAKCFDEGQLHFDIVAQIPAADAMNSNNVPQQQFQQKPQSQQQQQQQPRQMPSKHIGKPIEPPKTVMNVANKKVKVKRAKPEVGNIKSVTAALSQNQMIKTNQVLLASGPSSGQLTVKQVRASSSTPLLKNNNNNMVVSKLNMENTAVDRQNLIAQQQQSMTTAKAKMASLPPTPQNRITITSTITNAAASTNSTPAGSVAPSTPIKSTAPIMSSSSPVTPVQGSEQQQDQEQPPQKRSVQTIQLTPEKQDLLKDLQLDIQQLSGRLRDKRLLDKIKAPKKLAEDDPIFRQPLPNLDYLDAMPDEEIVEALQRLFVEQQKILATGTVIPYLPQHMPKPASGGNGSVGNAMGQSSMTIQFSAAAASSSPTISTATTQLVKNLQMMKNNHLLKPQQFNEMTIKPIISTSHSTSTPIPNKVINSTTIIPAPMTITTNMVPVQQQQQHQQHQQQIINSNSITVQKRPVDSTVSIIPMIVPSSSSMNNMTGITASPMMTIASVANQTSRSTPTTTVTAIMQQPAAPPVMIVPKQDPQPEPPVIDPQIRLAKISRFERQLRSDQEGCTQPDTVSPFRSKRDAVNRLIVYHCNSGDDAGINQNEEEEERQFLETANNFRPSYQSLLTRYQYLMMQESTRHVRTSELAMMEKLMLADVQSEVVDIQREIDRLNNPLEETTKVAVTEPTIMESVKKEEEPIKMEAIKPPTIEAVKSSSTTSNGLINGQNTALEDETTRTSVSDSQSQADIKSENQWNDEWNDWDDLDVRPKPTVNRFEGAQSSSSSSNSNNSNNSKPPKMKKEEEFDIESEILPNFILNKKCSTASNNSNMNTRATEDGCKDIKGIVSMTAVHPEKIEVKSQRNYEEWLSIQKELASIETPTIAPAASDSEKREEKLSELMRSSPLGNDLDELFSANSHHMAATVGKLDVVVGREDNSGVGKEGMTKKEWNPAEDRSLISNIMQHSCENSGLGLASGNNGQMIDRRVSITAPAVTATTYFGLSMDSLNHSNDHDNWLDNSFEFALNGTTHMQGSNQTTAIGSKRTWNNGVGVGGGGQLMNDQEMAGESSSMNGVMDDYYAKKMCYNNGEYDFNHLMMDNSVGGEGGSGGPVEMGMAVGSQNQSQSQQQSQQQHQQPQSHINLDQMDTDDDINRQVQNAIDSILNLQGSDSPDYQYSLDQTMGALLVDSSSGGNAIMGNGESGNGGTVKEDNHHMAGILVQSGILEQQQSNSFNDHMLGATANGGGLRLAQDNNSPTNSTSSQSLLSSISSHSSGNNNTMVRNGPMGFVDSLGLTGTDGTGGPGDSDSIKSVLTS